MYIKYVYYMKDISIKDIFQYLKEEYQIRC